MTSATLAFSPAHYVFSRASTAVATLLTLFVVLFNYYFSSQHVVDWDTFGYYLYLPQTFIHHDLEIRDRDKVEQIIRDAKLNTYLYQVNRLENGNHVMKYSMGMALLYSPAFVAGHVAAGLSGEKQDGFSPPYMIALKIWCILVSVCGIWLLRALLVGYVSDAIAAIVLVLTLLGSNYIHNVCMEGNHTLSHNFLFTGYALLILLTLRWHAVPTLGRMLALGVCAGLMILARPTEIVCLFIPLLWGVSDRASLLAKARLLARHWRQLLAFAGVLFLIGLPQLVYWQVVAGSFLHTSYGGDPGEGFEWAHPFTREVLFGFRKGWFIYTPMALLGVAGLAASWRHAREIFWPILLYLVLNVYLVSAWSCYWYANHYGQRALLPAMAVLALPLGVLLNRLWQARTWAGHLLLHLVLVWAAAFLVLNIFQTYQFQKGIIDGVRMTRAAYFTGFTDLHYGNLERKKRLLPLRYHNYERYPEYEELYTVRRTVQRVDFAKAAPDNAAPNAFPGTFRLYKDHPDSPPFDIAWKDLTGKDHGYLQMHVRLRCGARDSAAPACDVRMVSHFSHAGKAYAYRVNPLPMSGAGWVQTSACQITPEVRNVDDPLRIYLRYDGEDTVYVEGFSFDILEREE